MAMSYDTEGLEQLLTPATEVVLLDMNFVVGEHHGRAGSHTVIGLIAQSPSVRFGGQRTRFGIPTPVRVVDWLRKYSISD